MYLSVKYDKIIKRSTFSWTWTVPWGILRYMKQKIAVYANGWNMESLRQAITGIRKYAALEDFDVFIFLSYASYSDYATINQGELNLYKLADMEQYDGVIVMSSMLNSPPTAEALCRTAKEKHIPVVSIGVDYEGIPSIRIRNEDGMRELVTHLLEEHDVKRILFMGGTDDHVDSNERLEITRRIMEEHGLELTDEDVCYGYWGNTEPARIVQRLITSGKALPDAIVCANDIMALATASALINAGYHLPEDIIVTGFDHINDGTTYYPSISSVSPNFAEAGYKCCELLYHQIHGEAYDPYVFIPSSFVIGESCGCPADRCGLDYIQIRNNFCQSSYQKHLEFSQLDMRERLLSLRITELTDYHSLKTALQKHYISDHSCEGDDFCIVLYSDFFENPLASADQLFGEPFASPMEALVAFRDGEALDDLHIHNKNLIPGYQKKPGVQHCYYFCALHTYQYDYGYFMAADNTFLLEQDSLYNYLEKIEQSLLQLRSNLRLDMLNQDLKRIYDKDPMTGLYTRFVYEHKVEPIYEDCNRKNRPMTVMFVDINYMKRINDQFGHLQGDIAIRIVANSIRDNIQPEWIGVRFGGDEFLIIAPDTGEKAAAELKDKILGELEKNNDTSSRPYRITASCAYVVTDPSSGKVLEEYVREADQLMYKIKQEVHAKDGQPRT